MLTAKELDFPTRGVSRTEATTAKRKPRPL